MASVTEKVTEVLLGTEESPHLSAQSKETFMKHALRNEETGEHYLDEERFIDAIAPASEDYVCRIEIVRIGQDMLIGLCSTRSSGHNTPSSTA